MRFKSLILTLTAINACLAMDEKSLAISGKDKTSLTILLVIKTAANIEERMLNPSPLQPLIWVRRKQNITTLPIVQIPTIKQSHPQPAAPIAAKSLQHVRLRTNALDAPSADIIS